MAEPSTPQQLISVGEIRDNTLVLKSGGLRRVLLVSGINFELKSQAEQEALIAGFQEFLASLDFSLQVLIHSRKINIDSYLSEIERLIQGESNELLKLQGRGYVDYIRSYLETFSVMEKKIFVVIPYEPVEVSPEAVKGGVTKLLKRQAPTFTPALSEENFSRYYNQLITREEGVISGLLRLGINAIPLGTEELIEVMYMLYNPVGEEMETIKPFPVPEQG